MAPIFGEQEGFSEMKVFQKLVNIDEYSFRKRPFLLDGAYLCLINPYFTRGRGIGPPVLALDYFSGLNDDE